MLEEAAQKIKEAKNKELFIDFLQAFMDEEEQHINKHLSAEDFNLRTASLCAEAYAAARLMKDMLEES